MTGHTVSMRRGQGRPQGATSPMTELPPEQGRFDLADFAGAITSEELARIRAFIASAPWTPAKWAEGTRAQHQYVMRDAVDGADFDAFVDLIFEQGYKARWRNPITNRTYFNRYYECGPWTYWLIFKPRCLNREHRSVDTLRRPVSKAEAEAQLELGYPPVEDEK